MTTAIRLRLRLRDASPPPNPLQFCVRKAVSLTHSSYTLLHLVLHISRAWACFYLGGPGAARGSFRTAKERRPFPHHADHSWKVLYSILCARPDVLRFTTLLVLCVEWINFASRGSFSTFFFQFQFFLSARNCGRSKKDKIGYIPSALLLGNRLQYLHH